MGGFRPILQSDPRLFNIKFNMSTLNTEQTIDPPVVERIPGQIIKARRITQKITTDFDQTTQQLRPFKRLNDMTSISWSTLALMMRMIYSYTWTTLDEVGPVDTIELDIKTIIEKFVPINPPAVHFDFDGVRLVVHKNTNPMFQGKMLIVYDPTPSSTYYSVIYDRADIFTERFNITQFAFADFDTTNTDSIEFQIDNFIPFDFFRKEGATEPTTNDMVKNNDKAILYFQNYSLGRIRFFVFNKLQTTSDTTFVPVQMMGQLTNYKYAGRSIN